MEERRRPDPERARELAALRIQLDEAEQTLRAIRSGEIDAIVVDDAVYTLDTAHAASNRLRSDVLAQMKDAVVAVDLAGRLIYLNAAAESQYGMGSALTIIPIQAIIKSSGYESAFLYFGIAQGLIVFLLSFGLAAPARAPAQDVKLVATTRNYTWTEMIRTPVFWLMYLMFVLMAAGGLMATAQLAPIAKDFKIADIPVSILGLTLPALTFALSIDRVLNGLTRPFFGWVSDNIGRENTMFIAFGIEGLGIWALYVLGHNPVWFVILSGLVFFAWGEIYSLFPSTCTDTFGAKFATTNAGLLYTAKGTAALLVPIANYVQQTTGSWDKVFIIAAGANILASLLAIVALKPWRRKVVAEATA